MISNPSFHEHVFTPLDIIPYRWTDFCGFWPFLEMPRISLNSKGLRNLKPSSMPFRTPWGMGLDPRSLLQAPRFEHDSRPGLHKRYRCGLLVNGSYPSHAPWLNHHDLRFQRLSHALSQAFLLVQARVTASSPDRTHPLTPTLFLSVFFTNIY